MGTSKVVQACEKEWDANQHACNEFVIAVASDLGIILTGNANAIIDKIQKLPWSLIKGGVAARDKAAAGYFVVGGLKAMPEGHVVVVVPGPLAHGLYPTAYWGSTAAGIQKKNTTINWAWTKDDRDKVVYAYYTSKFFI